MKRICVKRLLIGGVSSMVVLAIIIFVCNGIVVHNASGRTFDNVEEVPERDYGLLLATSPITPQGGHNFYFDNRIKSAVELYKAGGKVGAD